ncbi:hypothetical protein L7F22_019006 [Adiantum nelumboides]|nr:hypothetical protein [Adiantum nelumboides]
MAGSRTPSLRESGTTTPLTSQSSSTPLPILDKSGHQGNYSEEQKKTLLDFEEQLRKEDCLKEDYLFQTQDQIHIVLGRYLRARNWNIENAKKMYKDTLNWRKEVNIDQMLKPKEEGGYDFEERELIGNLGWKMYFHSTDKYHRPIFVQDLSNLQVHEVFQNTTPDRIVKFFALNLEDAVRQKYRACTQVAREEAKNKGATEEEISRTIVDDNFMILNVAGLGMSTFWSFKNKLQELLAILDANYPELSGRVQIINAPWLFTTIWSYIKVWLPPNTAAKIDIAGTDYHSTLFKFIDPNEFPEYMGGKCKCEGYKGGCSFSNRGPWNDEKEYQ